MWRRGKSSKHKTTVLIIHNRCKNPHALAAKIVNLINDYVGVQVASQTTTPSHIRVSIFDVNLRDDELLYILNRAQQEVEHCIDKVEITRETRTYTEYFNL